MKKKCVTFILIMIMILACSINAYAITPKYDIQMPTIPEIHVELSDEMKDAVDQAVQKQLEKMILDQPTVTLALHYKSRYSSGLFISWNEVTNATSYNVEIKLADGTSKIYNNVKYNCLSLNSYNDEFVSSDITNATVRVKAYGENETYSLWSNEVNITYKYY